MKLLGNRDQNHDYKIFPMFYVSVSKTEQWFVLSDPQRTSKRLKREETSEVSTGNRWELTTVKGEKDE